MAVPAYASRSLSNQFPPFQVVSLILPEDQSCNHGSHFGRCSCVVRTGGDILRGHIVFLAPSPNELIIDVCFEGRTSSNYIVFLINPNPMLIIKGFCRTWTENKLDHSRPLIYETNVSVVDRSLLPD